MNIDWNKAPEGATHYRKYTGDYPWYRLESDKRSYWNGVRWDISLAAVDHELAPIPVQWTGSGLPPVGTVCEFRKYTPLDSGEWTAGDVRYLSDCTIVIGGDKCEHVHHPRTLEFRPIRTPEQIEAQARTEAIDDMIKALGMDNAGTAEYIRCGLIYDAGFRKFEIVEGE